MKWVVKRKSGRKSVLRYYEPTSFRREILYYTCFKDQTLTWQTAY